MDRRLMESRYKKQGIMTKRTKKRIANILYRFARLRLDSPSLKNAKIRPKQKQAITVKVRMRSIIVDSSGPGGSQGRLANNRLF